MPKKTIVPLWHPSIHKTWTIKELQAWVDEYGPRAMWGGVLYEIKHKRICPGRYAVWWEP